MDQLKEAVEKELEEELFAEHVYRFGEEVEEQAEAED